MTDDLWGELPDVENIRTPHAILLEQASLLNAKTKGLLVARVTRTQSGAQFGNVLQIVAPSLNNYSYGVCSVGHSISLYPLQFVGMGTNPNQVVTCNDEEAFVRRLGQELRAQQTQRVIAGLLAQIRADLQTKEVSKAPAPPPPHP
jgi:hypothetical protein